MIFFSQPAATEQSRAYNLDPSPKWPGFEISSLKGRGVSIIELVLSFMQSENTLQPAIRIVHIPM